MTDSTNTSSGLEPNIAAGLSYLLIPITSIVFLVIEKENQFVRFHAFQSLFYGLACIVLSIALSIAIGIFASIPFLGFIGTIVGLMIYPVVSLGLLVFWVILLIKSFSGEYYKLPYLGDLAEKQVTKA